MKNMFYLLMLVISIYSSEAIATPVISSVSGGASQNETVTLTCSGAGENNITNQKFSDFEDGTLDGVTLWTSTGNANLCYSVTDLLHRTNSSYELYKLEDDVNTGAFYLYSPQSGDSVFYTCFWFCLANDYPIANGNNKFFRVGNQPTASTNAVLGQNMTIEFDKNAQNSVVNSSEPTLGVWHLYEIEIQLAYNGNSNNYYKVTIDGVVLGTLTDKFYDDEGFTKAGSFYVYGSWYNTTDGMGSYWGFDDIYFNTSAARVMIGNASTFEASTHREIQIPTSWSDTSITFTSNQGSFTDGEQVYLFVIDSDGNSSNGYAGYFLNNQFYSGTVSSSLSNATITNGVIQ